MTFIIQNAQIQFRESNCYAADLVMLSDIISKQVSDGKRLLFAKRNLIDLGNKQHKMNKQQKLEGVFQREAKKIQIRKRSDCIGAMINRPPTEKRPLWSFVQAGYSPYSYISK